MKGERGWVRVAVASLAALVVQAAAGEDFQLVLSGRCPGVEAITVAGATPGETVELYRGTERGDGTVPSGPCAGTALGLADPTFVASRAADAEGRVSLVVPLIDDLCGILLQAVDTSTCAVGNVGRLETGRPAPPARTGQEESFDPVDDGALQPGIPWPDPRFTDRGDGAVVDNLTGLVWLQDAGCIGGLAWEEALPAASDLADGARGLADGSAPGDWRLPNHRELSSLVDYGEQSPALPAGHPFTGVSTGAHWTSTTTTSSTSAWRISLDDGGDYPYSSKSVAYVVWPVRDEAPGALATRESGGPLHGGGALPLGSDEGLRAVVSGLCPGDEIVTVVEATPGGRLELWAGREAGDGSVPSGPCAGTPLGISDPQLVASGPVDADGGFSATLPVPDGFCGTLVEAVDAPTCATTGVARLETGRPAPVARTAQEESFAPGDDGDLGKGVAWPSTRFVDHGDGTVTDTVTGLVWLRQLDCFRGVAWKQALGGIAGLADGECGLNDGSEPGDWRMPTVRELKSVFYSNEAPPLPDDSPFSGSWGTFMWTSTSVAGLTQAAWAAFVDGHGFGELEHHSKGDSLCDFLEPCHAWPVKRGSAGQ